MDDQPFANELVIGSVRSNIGRCRAASASRHSIEILTPSVRLVETLNAVESWGWRISIEWRR